MQGKIVKGMGGRYTVRSDGKCFVCGIRGALRRGERICVGDDVEFNERELVIEHILPRRNFLLRPGIANVDILLFLIAPSPKPDLFLLDKIIVRCISEKVPLYLCINKSDIADDKFIEEIKYQYKNAVDGILVFSAKTGEGISKARELTEGKFACLSGQSAVGKSSLLNALFPNVDAEVGELSKKTERGKHTTRHSEVFLTERTMLCDTPGFSSLESPEISPASFAEFYPDYFEMSHECKYPGCTHTKEPDCNVKRAVEEGILSAERYKRYIVLYEELKNRWCKRYE